MTAVAALERALARIDESNPEIHAFVTLDRTGAERAAAEADAARRAGVSRGLLHGMLIGVKDIVVVDTPDALLVTTSEHAQRVKGVVDALKLTGRGDVL
ncbi:MAG: hypothetical protein J0I66_11665 [Microbacterium sp.]|nr:hypothetical protein [Microbacterium sp.]